MTNDEFAVMLERAMRDAERCAAADQRRGGLPPELGWRRGLPFELGFLKSRLEAICEELRSGER